MRVVAGKYKGKRWDVPHTFKARPTTDFAKEGLFNILANRYVDFDSQPVALDLFGGTGSISLEMLSRGCAPVFTVEKDFRHMQYLRRVQTDLGDRNWRLVQADVENFLKGHAAHYDLIFADPPYTLEWLAEIPDLVFANSTVPMLKPDGIFVLEHGRTYDFAQHPHFVDHRNYGSVNFSFFK